MPRKTPADEHYVNISPQAFAVVARVLDLLNKRGTPYVLGGGWALYAYGSKVPSVDTDVFLSHGAAETVLDAVRALGVTVGQGGQFEVLDFDGYNAILGPDADLGETERGYVPADVLRGRTVTKTFEVHGHGRFLAVVPQAPELAFMKLKAYHDRELAWRAHGDPVVMAAIPPGDRAPIRAKTSAHFFRKAGKDLYDLAFLAAHQNALDGALAIAKRTGLHDDVAPLTQRVQAPLLEFALDMTRREADTVTEAWLRNLTTLK